VILVIASKFGFWEESQLKTSSTSDWHWLIWPGLQEWHWQRRCQKGQGDGRPDVTSGFSSSNTLQNLYKCITKVEQYSLFCSICYLAEQYERKFHVKFYNKVELRLQWFHRKKSIKTYIDTLRVNMEHITKWNNCSSSPAHILSYTKIGPIIHSSIHCSTILLVLIPSTYLAHRFIHSSIHCSSHNGRNDCDIFCRGAKKWDIFATQIIGLLIELSAPDVWYADDQGSNQGRNNETKAGSAKQVPHCQSGSQPLFLCALGSLCKSTKPKLFM